MKAFFKLTDNRCDRVSVSVRVAEIVGVSDPQSDRHDWIVVVHMRSGGAFTMSGDINTIYRQRDELMYALEQDAKPVQAAATANLDPLCSATLKAQGLPYPRTCPVHGLGPCPTIRAEEATGD